MTRAHKYISNTSNSNIWCSRSEKVNNTAGTGKLAWEIAAKKVLLHCDDILDFLEEKFEPGKQTYVFNETTEQKLDIERPQADRYKYYTITGSSKLHVMVLTPTYFSMKASNIICVCSSCQLQYGSYPNFEEYPFHIHEQTSQDTLKSAHLQED